MYVVIDPDAIGRQPDVSRWLATVVIDELGSLALDYQEAAGDHRGKATPHSRQCVRSLDQATQACQEIIQLLRDEYVVGFPRHARIPER